MCALQDPRLYPMRSPRFAPIFGTVVRRRREQRALSQEKLAELAGVHRNYIGLIERAERVPSLEIAWRVATALGTHLSSLIEEAERAEQKKRSFH